MLANFSSGGLRSGNVRPQGRRHKARQMANVRRSNHCIRNPKCDGLCRQNHIAVQRLVIRCWLTLLTGLSPEQGGLPHCHRGEGQILQQADERVQAREPGSCLWCATIR